MLINTFFFFVDVGDNQNSAISKFRQFATSKNVHITLVIHPRKTEDGRPLNTASVFGSVKGKNKQTKIIKLNAHGGGERKRSSNHITSPSLSALL